jgi:hypothetical protein
MTVDTQKFQDLLLATEVASPDRDDGPHMRKHYDGCRAAFVAHLDAALAAARRAGMLEAARLAEGCMTGLGAAGQIRALVAREVAAVQPASATSEPEATLAESKLCYCTGGPNNHQSGCTEGFPSDPPDYELDAAPTPVAQVAARVVEVQPGHAFIAPPGTAVRHVETPAQPQRAGNAENGVLTVKIDCGECNDTGIVGYPPDQYAQCPDCTGQAVGDVRAQGEGGS